MRLVPVVTKRKGSRPSKSYAECNPDFSESISFSITRPNMKRSLRDAMGLL
jgi:hypothetical protein